jgi:hypothetical protein
MLKFLAKSKGTMEESIQSVINDDKTNKKWSNFKPNKKLLHFLIIQTCNWIIDKVSSNLNNNTKMVEHQ